MKNKFKIFVMVCVIVGLGSLVYAADNLLTVPLGHRAYGILQNAELRGIIPLQHNVRPYSTSKVLKDLNTIGQSSQISDEERRIVQDIIQELSLNQEDNSLKSVMTHGSIRQYYDELDVNAEIGARFSTRYTQSLIDFDVIDWRNSIEVYLRGDVKSVFSFEMNLTRLFDHIDHRPFLKNDFYIDAKGKYDSLWLDEAPFLNFGGTASPELAVSLFNNKLDIRFASIKRDWGVGTNNLMLSESANSMNALELQLEITPWLRYAFLAGRLGSFSYKNFREDNQVKDFYNEYLFTDDLHGTQYDNNYSAHRVEVDLPWNISLSVFESVVYRRRFELGYLNPFSILFYEQEIVGDFDNMLAGLDFEWVLPRYGRMYGVIATTEMSVINPKRFLTAPRNIMGIQGGVDINIPFLPFTTVTAQYTYLAPFLYTHYPMTEDIWVAVNNGSEEVPDWELVKTTEEKVIARIPMVHEGRNIGYPLRPNSDEILLMLNSQFKDGWEGSLTFKYQRRSGQYGFNIDKHMSYGAAHKNAYDDKDFNGFLFDKTIAIEMVVQKTLAKAPVRLRASYLMTLNSHRNQPEPQRVWLYGGLYNGKEGTYPEDFENYDRTPVIDYTVSGAWSAWKATHAVSIGVDIWF
ncbi:MAG: hypothetical protein ACOX0W_02050 [Sphaerochaetaceae bacterium]|jgi:hypothetical protein